VKKCSKSSKVRTFVSCFTAITTWRLLAPAPLYRCVFQIWVALSAQPHLTAICMRMQVPMRVHTFHIVHR
jgi:hypothetical protein